jgi:hypothetical protein
VPRLGADGDNPLVHFLTRGASEGRSPHPAFDIAWYRRSRGNALGEKNPLVDYVVASDARRTSPHPLFNTEWYSGCQPPAQQRGTNPLLDYLEFGVTDDLNPHPLFDTLWYLTVNPDAIDSGLHPFIHFLRSDPAECRQTSPWFDANWYRTVYKDVASSGLHALTHYVTLGRTEGRQPSQSLPFRQAIDLAQHLDKTSLPPMLAYLAGADLASTRDPAQHAVSLGAASIAREAELAPDEYWLPDLLREYVIDRFGDDHVPFLRATMAIIARHETDQSAFAQSDDCRHLVAELCAAAVDDDPKRPIDVSIVLPVFNNLVFTLTCLRSIFAGATRYRFEVLVGDDASTDATGDILDTIGGRVRHVRHPENLGFLLNCNLTALSARGRHIVFLNNDVVVLPYWLDELIGLLESDPKIGYVGS